MSSLLATWRFLARKIARKFSRRGPHEFDDLEQEALIGLWQASLRWNGQRKAFGPWVYFCIDRRLRAYCETQGNGIIKIPRYIRQGANRVRRAMDRGDTEDQAIAEELTHPRPKAVTEATYIAGIRLALRLTRTSLPTKYY